MLVCPSHVRRCTALLPGILLTLALWASPAYAAHPCDPPNVIPAHVCNFDSFRGSPPRQIPNGFTEFIIHGDPTFMQDEDTYWGPPSLRIWSSGGTFKVGIYTQVEVTAGTGYRASLAWGAPNSPETFGRQLGIDPTGGTDPNSPNIVWGPMHWGPGRILNYPPPDVNIDVKARAANNVITVFFLVDHPRSTGDNLIFVDALALYPDESAPAIDPPTATPEPPPAAPPPQQAQPPVVAAAPLPATPTPTDTPQPTATPTATESPTPLPTTTPTPTPSPTVTATWTAWPTRAPITLRAQSGDAALRMLSVGLQPAGLRFVAVLSLVGAGLFGTAFLAVRRRR